MVYSTDMYPVQFSVEYPEDGRNRLTALVRIILAIPILIILGLVARSLGLADMDQAWNWGRTETLFISAGLFLATMQVSSMVVRLEPRGKPFLYQGGRLPISAARRIPLHRRTAGRHLGNSLSRCSRATQPDSSAY